VAGTPPEIKLSKGPLAKESYIVWQKQKYNLIF